MEEAPDGQVGGNQTKKGEQQGLAGRGNSCAKVMRRVAYQSHLRAKASMPSW